MNEDFERVWDDQASFNRLLRPAPTTETEMIQQAQLFVLGMTSELHELLRLFQWKPHRRDDKPNNPAHRRDELADVFKYFLSLCQACGLAPSELLDAYWLKSAVVRQRYQEEWLSHLDRPCAVVDIDQVICNYVDGLCDWIQENWGSVRAVNLMKARSGMWINAGTLGITEEEWKDLKHNFRVSSAKQTLPIFADARPFLDALRRRNLQIILLTSRPIDRYPNLYADTLAWLTNNQLPFDFIWWATDKAERLIEGEVRHWVRLIVDDDLRYLVQYSKAELHSYWLQRARAETLRNEGPLIHPVTSLQQVVDHYDERIRETEKASWTGESNARLR